MDTEQVKNGHRASWEYVTRLVTLSSALIHHKEKALEGWAEQKPKSPDIWKKIFTLRTNLRSMGAGYEDTTIW